MRLLAAPFCIPHLRMLTARKAARSTFPLPSLCVVLEDFAMRIRWTFLVLLCGLALTLSLANTQSQAEGDKFFNSTVDKVFDAAAKSGKGALVICGANVPGTTLMPIGQFEAAISNVDVAKHAGAFERAYINCFSIAHATTNECVNPTIEKRFGAPVSVCAYVPCGVKPIWQEELVHQSPSNTQPKIPVETMVKSLKTAHDSLDAFNKSIADIAKKYEAKDANDKKLAANADAQVELADAYVKGFALEPALAALDAAIKALKKQKADADKKKDDEGKKEAAAIEARVETIVFHRGEIAAMCESYARALTEYEAFIKQFAKSERVADAHLGRLTALAHMPDKRAAARAAINEALGNKKLADIHEKARALLDNLDKPDTGAK